MHNCNLTLKHFILKKQVFDLYRHVIRASRAIPDRATRRETVAWYRSEFERNRYLTDTDLIEDKLKTVRREVNQILPRRHW
ncbi:hypothetical protein K435DRAFT_758902 [Dendrothele bispora CBS 962.96]|uniref:LYR motif-containing protein 2 n=1 Tax=Dendrothele bispora (strain CBS 962.96) TaxID=1314807 RepID=A0A4S8LQQ6_DENBC|nr:hypothetical protein K435DRAFT_758902 [Dendrothele bispora CBS 962.96]